MKAFLIAAALFVLPASANAAIITFDDLPIGTTPGEPPYAGLIWHSTIEIIADSFNAGNVAKGDAPAFTGPEFTLNAIRLVSLGEDVDILLQGFNASLAQIFSRTVNLPTGSWSDQIVGVGGLYSFLVSGPGDAAIDNVDVEFAAVPEPGTFAFVGFGLLGLLLFRSRRTSWSRCDEASASV